MDCSIVCVVLCSVVFGGCCFGIFVVLFDLFSLLGDSWTVFG